jgi:ferredoxin
MPEWSTEYQLVEVDADYLGKAVKPKQFIHIDQSECIMCEGCVDICPWKCIHMVTPDAISEAQDTEMPGSDPSDNVLFIIDDDVCTRCALCVDRCPTGKLVHQIQMVTVISELIIMATAMECDSEVKAHGKSS